MYKFTFKNIKLMLFILFSPIKLDYRGGCFFTRNTPKIFVPPSARCNFLKCAPPPNLKSWIRPWTTKSLILLVLSIPLFFPLQNFSAEQGILNMHVKISSWQNKFGSKEFFLNYVIPEAYKYVYAKYNDNK